MRGCFHVLVFGDGLLSACDNRIVFHEVLVTVGTLLGLTGFLSAVRVLGLVEVQRIRRLVEGRRLAGAGVTVLFASSLFEAVLKPRAKFSPDSVARASPEDW